MRFANKLLDGIMLKQELPDVHFGSPEHPPVDWRKAKDHSPDDDNERPAPGSVIKLLGVNPDKLFMPKNNKEAFHDL